MVWYYESLGKSQTSKEERLGYTGLCKISCAAVLLLISVSAAAQDPSALTQGATIVPLEFNRRFGLILLKVEVEGKPATLVLDTGSSRTILSTRFAHIHEPPSAPRVTPSKGSGYVGSAVAIKATLKLGGSLWRDHDFLAMDDLPDISQSLGQKIDGILGQDLLRDFQTVEIDFRNKRLVLSR
jgi:hypothetical protein